MLEKNVEEIVPKPVPLNYSTGRKLHRLFAYCLQGVNSLCFRWESKDQNTKAICQGAAKGGLESESLPWGMKASISSSSLASIHQAFPQIWFWGSWFTVAAGTGVGWARLGTGGSAVFSQEVQAGLVPFLPPPVFDLFIKIEK